MDHGSKAPPLVGRALGPWEGGLFHHQRAIKDPNHGGNMMRNITFNGYFNGYLMVIIPYNSFKEPSNNHFSMVLGLYTRVISQVAMEHHHVVGKSSN